MIASPALRLRHADTGFTLGAGVLVGHPPRLLTCAHVVRLAPCLEVRDCNDRTVGRVGQDAFLLDEDRDLAIAEIDWLDAPASMALQLDPPASTVQWSGYPYEHLGVRGVIAGEGKIATLTRVEISGRVIPAFQLLGTPPLSPGMSGGPLVDTLSGAVIALTAAEFSERLDDRASRAPGFAGFACPLTADSQPLTQALGEAEATVPRFGARPNRLGAEVLLRACVEAATLFAEERLDYRPDHTIDRPMLDEEIRTFIGSARRIMPVIGDSGVGKTTFLQRWLRSADRPILLARCATFEPAGSVEAMLSSALGLDVARSPAGQGASFPTIARQVGPGILLLDGLNELPATVRWEEARFGRELTALLAEADWKAVVTTRLEGWSEYGRSFDPAALHLATPAISEDEMRKVEPHPVRLGDFSDAESDAFLAVTAASADLRGSGIRNPLTLSLALRQEGAPGRLGLDDLLELQLDESLRRIARGRGALARPRLKRLCVDLAENLLRNASSEIVFEDIPADRHEDFTGLITETLLVPSGRDRWRFRYDRLLEYLQAEAVVDLKSVVADPALRDGRLGVGVPVAVLAAGARRLSRNPDRSPVQALLAAAARRDGAVMAALLGQMILVDEDLAALETALADLADPEGFQVALFVDGFSDPPWRSRAIGFAVLRTFVTLEKGYGWRTKDVRHGTYTSMNLSILKMSGAHGFLLRHLEADREGTLACLQAWLSDPARMQGNEGSLASWTLNVIDLLKEEIGPATFLEMALKTENIDKIDACLNALTRAPDQGLGAIEGMAQGPGLHPRILLSAVRLIQQALTAGDATIPSKDAAHGRLESLLGSMPFPPSLEGERLELLARLPRSAERAWRQYRAQAPTGRADLRPMGVFLEQYPEEAFALLETHWRQLGDVDDVAGVVCSSCPDLSAASSPNDLALWRRRLEFVKVLIPDAGPNFHYRFETLLFAMDETAAEATGLIALTHLAVRQCGDAFTRNLRYCLCGRASNAFGERESLERRLCREIVETGSPAAAAIMVANLEETVAQAQSPFFQREVPPRFLVFVEDMHRLASERGDVVL